jgi:hypothetical protein
MTPPLTFLKATPIRVVGGPADRAIFFGLLHGTPVLTAWSVALFAVDLRQPRSPLRRLLRWPGFVVNASSLLGATVILAHDIGDAAIVTGRASVTVVSILSIGLPGEVGDSALGASLAWVLRGRRRPRPFWTDRLGSFVGMVRVFMAFLTWSRLYLILMR